MARRASNPQPILCAVLDGEALGAGPHTARETAASLFAAGVDWIQLRDRSLPAKALFALACDLVAARDASRAVRPGLRVVVNKRSDVALAAGADGVHLGVDAIDARSVAALLHEFGGRAAGACLLGASLHSSEELERLIARGLPLAYAHLAPIWSPRSKPAERPELGIEVLARAAALATGAQIALFAQGGLDAARAAEAVAAGAAGIAVTGGLSQAGDPLAATRALRRALDLPHAGESATDTRARPLRTEGGPPR